VIVSKVKLTTVSAKFKLKLNLKFH